MEHILITGSNRGIGYNLVKQLLSQDCLIFATCRNPASADELNQLAAQSNGKIQIIPLDLDDEASIQQAFQQVSVQVDHLDLLINNAGINPKTHRSLEDVTTEIMLDVFRVNAVAPLLITRQFLPLLKNGHNPRVINVSSQVGSMTWKKSGGSYPYAASKAALNMVTRCLAGDLGPEGITVITLHPGWVQTNMGGDAADLKPEESAAMLMTLINRITRADNGKFYKWTGEEHPW
ncbi:SDR family oxidoreductase [Anaerolineales bacterium]